MSMELIERIDAALDGLDRNSDDSEPLPVAVYNAARDALRDCKEALGKQPTTDLNFATFDELVEEIAKRTMAMILGFEMEDVAGQERTKFSFRSTGGLTRGIGLATMMRASMVADALNLGPQEPEDE